MCDANNARRNRMWTISYTRIKCGNIELQVCHSRISYSCRLSIGMSNATIDFYPIFVYLFISFLFDRFVPISFGGCMLYVCVPRARNKCNRKLLLLRLNAPKNVFKLDRWWHFSFLDHKKTETKNEMQRMKEIFFFAETSSSSLLSSVCISPA